MSNNTLAMMINVMSIFNHLTPRRLLLASAVLLTASLGNAQADDYAGSAPVKEPLKGGVEDSSVEPTRSEAPKLLEQMPTPVVPPRKQPLQGNIEQSGAGRPMQGAAEDEDESDLKSMNAKAASTEPHPLQGNLRMEDSALHSQDPDADDQELQVQWDKWRNRFLWAVQNSVQELINNGDDAGLRWDPRRQTVVRQFPLGTQAWFACKVNADRQIVSFKLLQSSGFPNYDAAVKEAVADLQGSAILKFPARSKRQMVTQAAGIKTAESSQNEFFHFGDVEKYRVPGGQ